MSKKTTSSEYRDFDRTMRELIKIPHRVIKERLDAEKQAKKQKKLKVSSASRAAV